MLESVQGDLCLCIRYWAYAQHHLTLVYQLHCPGCANHCKGRVPLCQVIEALVLGTGVPGKVVESNNGAKQNVTGRKPAQVHLIKLCKCSPGMRSASPHHCHPPNFPSHPNKSHVVGFRPPRAPWGPPLPPLDFTWVNQRQEIELCQPDLCFEGLYCERAGACISKPQLAFFATKKRIWGPRLVCGESVGARNIFVMLVMYLWFPEYCICIAWYDIFVADPRHICRLITNGTERALQRNVLWGSKLPVLLDCIWITQSIEQKN